MEKFYNLDKIIYYLEKEINDPESKIIISGDYDVDGLMSLMILKDTLTKFSNCDFKCYPYVNRTHNIDKGLLNFCLMNNASLVIICDTGSDSLETLEKFQHYGIKCIVMDHHSTQLRYRQFPESVSIINTFLDAEEYGIHNTMCGAAIVFVVCAALMEKMGIEYDIGYFACYALIAMYADTIPMNTDFAHYLYETCETRTSVPPVLDVFLGEHQTICRRFAEYWFSPKVNATFRREQFSLINSLFIEERGDIFGMVKEMSNLHANTIALVERLVSNVEPEDYGDLTVTNLSLFLNQDLPNNFIINHTGRIANAICEKTKKASICVCDSGLGIKGSLRDPYGRDFLKYYAPLFKAGGHPPAFGFEILYTEWDYFMSTVKKVGNMGLSELTIDNDVVDMRSMVDMYAIDQIARDNEFSCVECPPTYVYVRLNKIVESHKYADYGYLLVKDPISPVWINSSRRIHYPQDIILYPYKSNKTKLQVVWR